MAALAPPSPFPFDQKLLGEVYSDIVPLETNAQTHRRHLARWEALLCWQMRDCAAKGHPRVALDIELMRNSLPRPGGLQPRSLDAAVIALQQAGLLVPVAAPPPALATRSLAARVGGVVKSLWGLVTRAAVPAPPVRGSLPDSRLVTFKTTLDEALQLILGRVAAQPDALTTVFTYDPPGILSRINPGAGPPHIRKRVLGVLYEMAEPPIGSPDWACPTGPLQTPRPCCWRCSGRVASAWPSPRQMRQSRYCASRCPPARGLPNQPSLRLTRRVFGCSKKLPGKLGKWMMKPNVQRGTRMQLWVGVVFVYHPRATTN